MNVAHIIGNIVNDPEKRSTRDGTVVTNFTVAVNRRPHGAEAKQETDYFRVTAWRGLAEVCVAHLRKGRKVAVSGPVSVSVYEGRDGKARGNLEMTADDVEFLTPKDQQPPLEQPRQESKPQFVQVDDEELPFD